MGIIFTNNKKKTTVGELLKTPRGRLIASRLQAGRVQEGNVNRPYRLNDEELMKLKDEVVYWEANNDCYYAYFEKPVNEIRAILGLEPQSDNPFDLF